MMELKKIDLKEQQSIMLNILKCFADFCEEHNLNYFLDAGTLLGAVRHNGFIPWDNDIDVCMPRPDMVKFLTLLKDTNYKIRDHIFLEQPEDTIYPYYKLSDDRTLLIEYPVQNPIHCYIYIDIFVKDGLPDNMRRAKRICNKSRRYCLENWFYKYSLSSWPKSKNLFKKIVAFVIRPFVRDKNRALKKQINYIKKINNKYPYNTCSYVTTLSNGEFHRMCLKSNFDSFLYHDFEGLSFRIPAGFDNWLTVLYGADYMTPPPIDKQIVHEIEVYWRDGYHEID